MSDYSTAVAEAGRLAEHILAQGVRDVSIELVEGRGGSGWISSAFVGTLGHHIVSRRSQGLTPGLRIIKEGRSDLPGPLANVYGGFDEIARVVCMSYANHPGQGGPYSLPAGTIPANNGRPYLFGHEFEGGLDLADWTPSYRLFMARTLAGSLAWMGRDARSHLEHQHWAPTRKIDRLGYDNLTTTRSEIQAILDAKEGSTMFVLTRKRSHNHGDGTQRSDIAYVAGKIREAFSVGSDKVPADGSWPSSMVAVIKDELGGDGSMVTGNMALLLERRYVAALTTGAGTGKLDDAAFSRYKSEVAAEVAQLAKALGQL